MAQAKNYYRYLLEAVDVYSRFSFAVPMKTKDSGTICNLTNAIEHFIQETTTNVLNTDLGSESNSQAFVKRMTSQ